MNETLIWLSYGIGAVLAFAAVNYRRWHVGLAILVGALVSGAGWTLVYYFTEDEKRPAWVQLDLALNLSFGLIFAALAALLAKRLVTRRGPFE